ncbi:MAG: class II aldolase/adducin family protein [Micromonosporaceae bacterium]|nr:class II aldolase/adducin family protein [Micromonosporaceae bacterium]
MSIDQPYPDCGSLLGDIGRAGRTMAAISACEGAAGNISVCCGWPIEMRHAFQLSEPFDLPDPVPALAGHTIIVTGSGQRLREIADDPAANLGAVVVGADGRTATLLTSPSRRFARLTSELNSHLSVHADQVQRTGTNFSALIHAQPPRTTLLSHIPEYRSGETLTRRLLRWEPETLVNLPEGIAVLPYLLPGSPQLMAATVRGLRDHRIVVWSKHGVMARSDACVTRAADLIEYTETAALYEHLNLASGGRGEGLSDEELRGIAMAFNLPTALY